MFQCITRLSRYTYTKVGCNETRTAATIHTDCMSHFVGSLYSSSCNCFYFSHIAERTWPLVKLVPRQLAKIHYPTCLPTLHQTKNKPVISTNIHPREEWTALQDLQVNDTSLSMVCKTVINNESGVKLTCHSICQPNTVRARFSYSARIKINKTCWFLTNFYICRE